MKRQLLLVSIIFFLALISVSTVHADASETLMLTTTTSTASYSAMAAGMADPIIYQLGQAFNATSTTYLTQASLNIRTTNDTSQANCTIGLYTIAGDYGSDAYDYTLISLSDEVKTVGSLGGSANWVNWTFPSGIQLTAGTQYIIKIFYLEVPQPNTSAHNIRWSGPASDVYSGNQLMLNNETGYSYSVNDLGLRIYGDEDGPAATAAPFPTGGSYQETDTNILINTFVGYLIPLILFLLPALILGWLTHWAKWPILIGLAIGSGLTYLFLGTQYLWLVMIVVIGIGASAYQSSRGTG